MLIEPGYGETPLDPDEAAALTPQARATFGNDPTKFDLYEVEQEISNEVGLALFADVVAG